MAEPKPGTQNQKETTTAEKLQSRKDERIEVITVRNWKEYLGESLLIIFSVVLALGLTEWFSKLHEDRRVDEILHQLRTELLQNRKAEAEQYQYHVKIRRRLDSAIQNPSYGQQFLNGGEVHLSIIADSGVMRHDLDDVAWQIAKANNAVARLDLSTYSLLEDLYNNQQRITKTEDEVARVLLTPESRKPENLRTTLILISDNFFAWSVERGPKMLHLYDEAIERLKDY